MSAGGSIARYGASLTTLADRYACIKAEVAVGLRARQEASRFGGTPVTGEAQLPVGKRDARRIAAERLGAGVSHTTLEKVLWLRKVAFDVERPLALRGTALDAYTAIDSGEPVSWLYDRVHTLVLVDDLKQVVAEAPADSAVKVVAVARLKKLQHRGLHAVTAAMKREARQAVAAARRMDQRVELFLCDAAPALPTLHASLKRLRRENEARYQESLRAKHQGDEVTGADGGASA